MRSWLFLSLSLSLLIASHLTFAHSPISPPTKEFYPKANSIIRYYNKAWQPIEHKEKDGFYRKFIKRTQEGYFVIQDFYANTHKKQTDPITLTDPNELTDVGIKSIEGPLVLWHANGKKSSSQNYQQGKQQGAYYFWYPDGQPQAEGYFEKGLLEGKNIVWYENQQIRAEGNFIKGKKDGLWQYWYKNGQLAVRESYQHGVALSLIHI